MITAPYNFVPLNKEVFYPEWSKEVSHDIPFSDEESGEIDITITAKSPIFIRNHSDDKDKPSEEFCNHNGKFYIPGASVKGMVRNILEIMSFSRITTQDKKYSFRDITNQEYKDRLMDSQKEIECGWLYIDGDSWKIYELGLAKLYKETHTNIAKVLDNKEVLEFPKVFFKPKTPENKYKKYNNSFEKLKTTDNKVAIFTGTINKFDDKEWLFPNPESSEDDISLDKKVIEAFKDAYHIGQIDESKVWSSMWKKILNSGGFVPVFFLKSKNKIEHFGLSLLYKLPYKNSIYEMIKSHNKELEKIDLAEIIFGYTKEKDNTSLKGRVQFSHFVATKVEDNENLVTVVLNSPKPTYYPNYVEQMGKNGKLTKNYNHYSSKNATIRGWKCYPLQSKEKPSDNSAKDSITTKFKPLGKETVFKGKLRYHNLKTSELGALLSALTFHGKENEHHHNIGMAKPLGYGEIKLEITNINSSHNSQEAYLDAFVELLESKDNWIDDKLPFKKNWIESKELVELMAMHNLNSKKRLRYQMLDNPNSNYRKNRNQVQKNEFVGAKNAKEYLIAYSDFSTNMKKDSDLPSKKANATKKIVVTSRIYIIQEVAKETSKTVQQVIEFSRGLHFGMLDENSQLKEPQAKDLMKRLREGSSTVKSDKSVQVATTDTISKTKLKKAITKYWKDNFSIMYHRNQIREFLFEDSFSTTPIEQQEPYIKNKNDKNFSNLCRDIYIFEFEGMDEEKKEKLYNLISKDKKI